MGNNTIAKIEENTQSEILTNRVKPIKSNKNKFIRHILDNKSKLKDISSYFGVACYILLWPVDGPIVKATTQDWVNYKTTKMKEKIKKRKNKKTID